MWQDLNPDFCEFKSLFYPLLDPIFQLNIPIHWIFLPEVSLYGNWSYLNILISLSLSLSVSLSTFSTRILKYKTFKSGKLHKVWKFAFSKHSYNNISYSTCCSATSLSHQEVESISPFLWVFRRSMTALASKVK